MLNSSMKILIISLQTKNKSETWKVNKEYQKLDQREEGKKEATGKVRTILFSDSLIIREGGLYICDSELKKKTRLVFSTHFSVFGYLMKHPSSCLIYY